MAETAVGHHRVLLDPDLDEALARDSMVIVPLAEPDELREIEATYWATVPPGEGGIVLDYLRDDRSLVRALADLMTPVWERVVPTIFEHHYPVYTSFVVKYPGADSSLFLHRDLAVDDERFHRTLSMWMPLTDTSPELDNGPLAFVRGSQTIRHGGFGPNAVGLFSAYDEHLGAQLEAVAVPAGSALVYDAKLLHASAPNRSERPRVAVGCLLASRERPVVQIIATGRRHRVVHAVDRDYFIDHPPAAIAEAGMPDRYAVIDEFDEEPDTDATVLGSLAADLRVQRRVIVPPDLEAIAGDRHPLAVVVGPRPGNDRDLDVTADDLLPLGPTVAGRVRATGSGAIGALDLVRRGRRRLDLPAAVADADRLGSMPSGDATLVVVEPGGRLSLEAGPGRFRRQQVVVVDCPAVRAGACAEDHVAELDLGLRVHLSPGCPVHLWNDGPGPLALVVGSSRSLRRAKDPGRSH